MSQAQAKLTYINNLFKNFHETLLSMIPIFEKCGIKWQDEQQFDDFEGITEALYRWIVIFKIENLINDKFGFLPAFPPYGFNYKDLSKMSFIDVAMEQFKEKGHLVFLSFCSKELPFDSVYCNKSNDIFKVVEKGIIVPINSISFRLQLRLTDGGIKTFA